MAKLLVVLLAISFFTTEAAAQDHYDVIIKDGRIIDGTGNPWKKADLAIDGDEIVAIGDLSGANADRIIEADGRYVTPGFIDVHSHAASGLSSEDLSEGRPLLAQGITTAVVNPDGGGSIDIPGQRDDLLQHGLGVNVVQMVPHGSLRREVVGEDDRAPTDDEMSEMREITREGMEEGAFGLTSGLFYSPGSYAENEELIELAREIKPFGGVYSSHIRDEGDYNIGLIAAVDEVIEVAREAEVPGIVTHVKALGPRVWGFSMPIVHRIEQARKEGVEVWTDQYPYEASATGLSAALIPRWAEAGGDEEFEQRLEDADTLERMKEDIAENLDRRGGAERIQFRTFSPDRSIEGKTLAEVSDDMGMDPIEATLELVQQGRVGIVSFNMHQDDVETLMRQPWTMTSSDGGLVEKGEGVPHPRNYGTFARKLSHYINDEQVMPLSDGIRSMTGLSASVFRMEDRGQLKPGMKADVVVFDLDNVQDHATFQDPHQLSEGMDYVFVNGVLAIDEGEFTDMRSGDVLRR